jgi:hypothetical protein
MEICKVKSLLSAWQLATLQPATKHSSPNGKFSLLYAFIVHKHIVSKLSLRQVADDNFCKWRQLSLAYQTAFHIKYVKVQGTGAGGNDFYTAFGSCKRADTHRMFTAFANFNRYMMFVKRGRCM